METVQSLSSPPSAPLSRSGTSCRLRILRLDALRSLTRRAGIGSAVIAAVIGSLLPHAARAEQETGYAVINVANGKVLAARNVRTGFIPASVSKLPASLVILDRLGAGYTFTTTLQTTGSVSKNGILKGDLILVGDADPSLTHDDLKAMIADLRAAGVRRITGAFYYDSSALPAIAQIEPRQPDDAAYNPPLGGLSVDFSRYALVWKKDKQGRWLSPVGDEVPMSPLPVSVPATVPPSGRQWMPVADPALFTATMMAQLAAQENIHLPAPKPLPASPMTEGPGSSAAPTVVASLTPSSGVVRAASAASQNATVLVRHSSQPVQEILRDALFYSNNMVLETLAMTATATTSPAAAGAAITKQISTMLPNVSWASFKLLNASGLTDRARMTPGQCAALTAYAATAVFDGVPYADLLRGRKLDPFMANDPSPTARLRTKTGTIYYGRALSGLMISDQGTHLAFCLMTDDLDQRKAYAAIPFDQRKDPSVRTPARDWLKAAHEQEATLVPAWARQF